MIDAVRAGGPGAGRLTMRRSSKVPRSSSSGPAAFGPGRDPHASIDREREILLNEELAAAAKNPERWQGAVPIIEQAARLGDGFMDGAVGKTVGEEVDPLIEGLAIAAMLCGREPASGAESALQPRLEMRLKRRIQQIRSDGRGGALQSMTPSEINWEALPSAGVSLLKGGSDPRTPLPRAGYRAGEGLRATLRKLATWEPDAQTRLALVRLGSEARALSPLEVAFRRYLEAIDAPKRRALTRLQGQGFHDAVARFEAEDAWSPVEILGALRAGAAGTMPELGSAHTELARYWSAGQEAAKIEWRE